MQSLIEDGRLSEGEKELLLLESLAQVLSEYGALLSRGGLPVTSADIIMTYSTGVKPAASMMGMLLHSMAQTIASMHDPLADEVCAVFAENFMLLCATNQMSADKFIDEARAHFDAIDAAIDKVGGS